MDELKILKEQAELNRICYEQQLIANSSENADAISDGFDSSTGKMRVRSVDGNIRHVDVITNGAIGIGDQVELRGNFADSMPRVRQEVIPAATEKPNPGIVTLLNVDLYLYPKPPDNNQGDFWLTGGKINLKKIEGFNVASNETVGFSAHDGFLLNLGSKFIATTKTYRDEYDYYNDDYNKRLNPQKYNFLANNQVNTLEPSGYNWNTRNTSNPLFCYLGNNIWQSYIEIGMGSVVNDLGVLGQYTDTDPFVSFPLDAVILPDNSNTVINNGISTTLSNSVATGSVTLDSFSINYGLINKTVNCTTWTPSGNTEFSYTATRSGSTTYTENIQGELLGLHFAKQYIIQQFNYTQIGNYIPKVSPEFGYNRSFTYSGVNNLFLKTVDSEETLQLNSNGKFLVVPLGDEGLTLESTILSLGFVEAGGFFNPAVDYSQIQALNLEEYLDEPVLFFQTINNKPYAIRGNIASITYDSSIFRFGLSVNITEFKPIPYSKGNENSLPTYYLILDNGCFWNYYLSQYEDGFNSFADTQHPHFVWVNNEYEGLWQFRYESTLTSFVIKCNQTLPFIHLSPISRYTIRQPYSERAEKINSDSLLSTDNLVGRKIYRVCYDYYINEYTSFVENSNKQRAIAQWNIDSDGNIFYKKTFLVDYKIKFPYLNDGELDAQAIVVNAHSYHP